MKTSYNVLDVFFNSLLFSNFKIENNRELKETDEKVLNTSFHQSPDKIDDLSSINILKNKYGIESECCKTFKTPLITTTQKLYGGLLKKILNK